MRTYRGVVCEKKTKYMVFLTEKGEFMRGVPIGDPPEVGEEVEFRLAAPSFIVERKTKPQFAGAVLVAAAVLFFIMSSLNPLNDKVMAYIQLEAGTAMEFGIDRKGNVISLRYFNETMKDAERLSAWEGHPLLEVLDKAVMELPIQHKQVIVTTIYPTVESKRETNGEIGSAVKQVRMKHEQLNLKVVESTPEVRTVANKKNMSIQQFKTTQTEESLNEKQPADDTDPVEEKPVQEQKLKRKSVPPAAQSQPKEAEKEQSNKLDKRQGPPTEKSDKKPNENRSENVPPHADKKGPPSSPPGLNKQNNSNQDKTGKPEKGKKDEKPANEKKKNSGPPF